MEPALTLELATRHNDRIIDIHRGDLTRILRGQSKIRLEDVLALTSSDGKRPGPAIIALKGSPGVGKSTLLWKFCKDWGEGRIDLDYRWVLLLCLQDSRISNAKDLKELCMFYWKENKFNNKEREEAYQQIIKSQGEGLLIALDGFDEAPTICQSKVFLPLLIEGHDLPNATILIATRASGLHRLFDIQSFYISHTVDLLGFLPNNITEYCRQTFPDDLDFHEFEHYRALHTSVTCMMYIPLNCAIVTEVYRECRGTRTPFPTTVTGLYSKLCCCTLLRYMNSTRCEHRLQSLSHPSDAPKLIHEKFLKVCRLAFDIESSCTVKHSSESPIDDMGFMQSFNEITVDRASVSYCFLHHTIQQYLAAYYIQQLPLDKQVQLLRSGLKNRSDENVWRFYAGLTRFKEKTVWKEIENVCFGGQDDQEKSMQTGIEEMLFIPTIEIDGLYLIYEAERGTKIFKSKFVRFRSTRILTPLDCTVLAYCISSEDSNWEIILAGEQMQDTHTLTSFIINLESHSKCMGRIHTLHLEIGPKAVDLLCSLQRQLLENILNLKMRRCNLDSHSSLKLQVPISAMELLETLDLSHNKFGNGGLKGLCKTLSTLVDSLKELHLRNTEIGHEDVEAICSLLQSNKITVLDLSENNLETDSIKMLSEALHKNDSIKTLYLENSKFDRESMVAFAKFLARNEDGLEKLYLQECNLDNRLFSYLATTILLAQNSSLVEIDISNTPFALQGARALVGCIPKMCKLQITPNSCVLTIKRPICTNTESS